MNRATMYTPKRKGELGLPDLLKYFYVAQVTKFHSQQPQTIWMTVTLTRVSPYNVAPNERETDYLMSYSLLLARHLG